MRWMSSSGEKPLRAIGEGMLIVSGSLNILTVKMPAHIGSGRLNILTVKVSVPPEGQKMESEKFVLFSDAPRAH